MSEPSQTQSPPAPQPRVLELRTDDWPERDRLAMFREAFGRDVIRLEPQPQEALRISATFVKFPSLGFVWGRRSAMRSEFSDGADRLLLNIGGDAVATQFGRDVVLTPGDAVALSGSETGSFTNFRAARVATIEFPNGALRPLLRDPAARCARRIPSGDPALRLLQSYVRAFQTDGSTAGPALQQLAVAHIQDLVAVALGASRHAEDVASGRGVRAARLAAIKDDIRGNLERELDVSDVAARHRMSARYLRMLFAGEETSVTEFVREERLTRAHRMLLSPRFDHLGIGAIAFQVGFNDLSYFNRTFRRRYGQSPREVRMAGREQAG